MAWLLVCFSSTHSLPYLLHPLIPSRDRSPADGYRLDRVDFLATGQPSQPSNSTESGTHVMFNSAGSDCSAGCFRPAGLAFDSKDRLFMTSDATGEIFMVSGT